MSELSETLTVISAITYGLAALLYSILAVNGLLIIFFKKGFVSSTKWLRVSAPAVFSLGLVINLFQLFSRWMQASQPPFKTLYESLILLAACIAVVYLVIEAVYRARILGPLSALGCLFVMLYALSLQDKEIVNLPPALQSGWFIPHVVVYFFGYAALVVATGAALLYLLLSFFVPQPIQLRETDLIAGDKLDLEAMMNTAVRFGFALLTFGFLVGGVWAKAAWGDYWVWDPKETWSLVTWLLFAAYLHMYYLGGYRGRRLAVLVLVGFGAIMFTYLGMNLLPTAAQSAHVYQ